MKKNFLNNNGKKNAVSTRTLRLESLEDRMLLAVTAGSESAADAAFVADAEPTSKEIVVADLTESALKTAIANAASGDTITFAKGGTISITSSITINKILTIDGAGKVTIDANGNCRLFNVSSSVPYFNLSGLTLTGGNADGAEDTDKQGGVFILESSSSATLTNCTVTDNHAATYGGAFYVYGKLYLIDCNVADNAASSPSSETTGAGGAMYIQGMWNGGTATVSAENTVFYNNVAMNGFGGVVENQCGKLYMKSCSVVGNTSGYGAITTWGALVTGKNIYNFYTAYTELEDTIVAYNFGKDETQSDLFEYYGNPGDVTYAGEAMTYANANKDCLLDNISCTNSIIGLEGEFFKEAPIFDASGNIINADTVDLTIRSDSAAARYKIGAFPTTYTGEEYSDKDLVVTTLEDVVDGTDGVVSLREALIYAELGEFSDIPTITFADDLAGGTIYLTKGALAINSSVTINGNGVTIDAQGESRVFFAKSYNYLMDIPKNVWTDVTLDQCPTHDYTDKYMIKVTLSDMTITGGCSGESYYTNGGGGVVAVQEVQLVMNNCTVTDNTFINNTGKSYIQGGGGIGVLNYSDLQMSDCVISENKVYARAYAGGEGTGTILYGGGIFTGNHATANITKSTITKNAVTTSNADEDPTAYGSWRARGGGVYSGGDMLNITYSVISENIVRGAVVENSGGGIYNNVKRNIRKTEDNYSLRVDNSEIVGNVAGDNLVVNNAPSCGGGVYSAGYTILIGDLIAQNVCNGGSVTDVCYGKTSSQGGGIYNSYLAAIYYCTITANECTMVDKCSESLTLGDLKQLGAGICNSGAEGLPTFIGCILVDNTSSAVESTLAASKADLRNNESATSFNVQCCLYDLSGISGSGISYTDAVKRVAKKALFTDAAHGDYTLPADSQAVDKISTTSSYYLNFYNWDLRNDPYVRLYNSVQDFGCYEYQPEPEPTPTFDCTITNYTGVYDAAAHTITINGLEEGDVVYYSNDGFNYQTDVIAYSSTGTRTIYVKVVREGHQDWTGSGTVSISQLQLTISGTTVADKVYDGTKAASVTLGTVTGILEEDDVVVAAAAEFPSADPGTYDLTVRYTLSGAQASNYIAPVSETVTATISEETTAKISVTIIVSNTAAASTELAQLPESISTATVGDTLYAQVWIKNIDGSEAGCTGGYIDLSYSNGLTVGSYLASAVFNSEADWIDLTVSGLASCFGGCSQTGKNDLAVSKWALLGTLTFTADSEGAVRIVSQEPTLNGIHIDGLNLSRSGEGNFKTNEIEYSEAVVTIEAGGGQLAAPTISTGVKGIYVSYGANYHQIQWGAVDHAAGYELAYSADDGATWKTMTVEGTDAVVTGLTYGSDVTYKVRALGAGSYTDSNYSKAKTFNVCPMDINNDGDIAGSDRSILASCWLTSEGDEGYLYAADINGDGDVAGADRNFLANNWLAEAGDDDLIYPKAKPAVADAAVAEFVSEFDIDLNIF